MVRMMCVWSAAVALGVGCQGSGGSAGDAANGGGNDGGGQGAEGDVVTDAASSEPGSPTDATLTFVMLGDSLTEGIGDSEWTDEGVQRGYPWRLRDRLIARGADVALTNLGKSGWTSTDMIQGVDWGEGATPGQLEVAVPLIEAAVASGRQAIACVWIGSNDLFGLYGWCHEPDNEACEAENMSAYESNLLTTISTLEEAGATIFIALLDDQSKRPVIDDPAFDGAVPGIDDAAAELMSAQVVRYNEALAELASTHGAYLVDFFSAGIFESAELIDADGVHPNAAGYEQITTKWEKALDDVLEL